MESIRSYLSDSFLSPLLLLFATAACRFCSIENGLPFFFSRGAKRDLCISICYEGMNGWIRGWMGWIGWMD